jgi:pyridoxal phosphate enzyme (YggS family)
VKQRLKSIYHRIQEAAMSCGRQSDEIQLVAVSKTMPKEKVLEAIDAGVAVFGENYVQEAREKFNALYTYPVSWHFIGHLQTNKAKYVVKMFDLVHSVDSLKLARELNKQAQKIPKIQDVLVQVNISEETSKSGVHTDELINLVRQMSQLDNISVRGLMTMPPYFNAPERVRPFFRQLRDLRDAIRAQNIPRISMNELSMGMTGDFEVAIEEGATLVRIGTAIFGERQ